MSSGLTSCGEDSIKEKVTLKVINSEDYIFIDEDDRSNDMTEQFKRYVVSLVDAGELEEKYRYVDVVYDTSDTNETLYSELQTGKSNYDLMNVSDYMAQKIVGGQMAVPLYRSQGASLDDEADYDMIPNYSEFASRNIKSRLDNIQATQKSYDESVGHVVERTVQLKDYAVGYMWGTLGILFNPEYPEFENRNISKDEAISDMQSVEALWNSKYNGTISIKNSMRDTYALGVLYTYMDEFTAIREEYLETGDLEKYQSDFTEIFNRCSENEVEEVRKSLEELKKNIFGLEVDSGKQDIITKKIGVNLAWSGDAVYSMDQGENLNEVKEPVELYYAVPELGSNLWMDVWVMPDCERTQEQYELAHLWLDFLSDPDNAYQNMDYTGYTSFIGGNSILELVRDWYDCRTDEINQEIERIEDGKYVYDYFQVYAYDSSKNGTDFFALDYPDFMTDGHLDACDNYKLSYFIPYEKDGKTIEEPVDLADLKKHSKQVDLLDDDEPVYVDEESEIIAQKSYKDLTIVDDEESGVDAIDLTYFFDGTLSFEYDEEAEEWVGYTDKDMIFYCYDYFYPLEEEDNISVGRQFFCQYPDEETINRCAVMRDYGENNKHVMKMWENFKSDPLPVWAIVVFALFLAAILALVTFFAINKILKNNLRKKRLQNK